MSDKQVRALQRRVKLAREGKRCVVVIQQRKIVGRGCLFWLVLGDFGKLWLAARAAVIGAAQFIGGCHGRWRWSGRNRQASPLIGAGRRSVGIAPTSERRRRQHAPLEIGVRVVAQLLGFDRCQAGDHHTASSGGSCMTSPGENSGRAVSWRVTIW